MADTRKDKRAPVSLKVRFKSATVDEFIEHYSKDVSRGGIYIKSSQPMPVGTLLKFQFQLKDESALIRGVGRVVWTRVEEDAEAEQPAGMGIKFIKMDNDSRAMVERIVDSQPDEGGTYESGRYNATSAEPSSAPPPSHTGPGGGAFFPDLPPAELPLPEDRTAVRQATEFLAAALTEGGTDEASALEAQKKADEARRRTEELEAQRREEADSKKRQEAEARASLRPKPPEPTEPDAAPADAEHDPDLDTAPTPRSLPSMIIDPSLEPRAGRASEQTAGSDVTPLPRPNSAVLAATGHDAQEPDTEPPPAPEGEAPRTPTTSIPQVATEPASRSYLPWLVLAAVLLVGAIVFLRGGPADPAVDPIDDKPMSQDEATRERAAPTAEPAPVPAAEPAAPVEPVIAPDAGAVEAVPAVEATQELAPKPGVELVTVEVSTSPRGAQVWLGDEQRGVAPVTLKLPAGVKATVRATAPGHSEAREELTPTKKLKLGLKLAPLPYLVRVESTPAGAAITVGAYKGVTPVDLTLDPPPTGQLSINAKLDGFEPAHTRLKLDSFSESDGAMRAQLSLTLQATLPKDTAKDATPAVTPKERPKKPAPAAKKPEAATTPASEVPVKPDEPAPAEVKPAEAKPAEAKPAEAKPVEAAPAPAAPAPAAPAAHKPGEPLPANPFGE